MKKDAIKILNMVDKMFWQQDKIANEAHQKWMIAEHAYDRDTAKNNHASACARMGILAELRDNIKAEFEI
jgi:hypothetical protein